jgi:methionine-rich copper-binding protein CopC
MTKAPTEVRVQFSETVQAGVSSIKVFDVSGNRVDKKDTHSDRANRAVLCVSLLPALTPGRYKVIWRVTSMDTHVANGDFRFQVLGTQRAAVSSQAR